MSVQRPEEACGEGIELGVQVQGLGPSAATDYQLAGRLERITLPLSASISFPTG